MGIKSFYVWFKSKFSNCIEKPQPTGCDNLMLDLNGIIHNCAQRVYHYGNFSLKKRFIDDTPIEAFANKDIDVWIEVCKEIDRLIELVKPSKRLVIAVDGVAPVSKQCLVAGTLVSMGNGTSKRIENILENEEILGWNGSGFTCTKNTGLQIKGEKDTVKVTLFDGRVLTLTEDHKVLLDGGNWKEAGKLTSKDKIISGLEMPEDVIDPILESNWNLNLDGYIFNMKTHIEREKSLALCRIMGLVMSDGYISCTNNTSRCGVYIGTRIDADAFVDDLFKITGIRPHVSFRTGDKGSVFELHAPAKLTKMLLKVKGIPVGKKVNNPVTIPDFFLDLNCPSSLIREFLGGLFGGDGHCPSCTNDILTSVRFSQSTVEKYSEQFETYMNNISSLLTKLGVSNYLGEPQKHAYNNSKIIPKDVDVNPRLKYYIEVQDTLVFGNKVGFRYATNKNLRLSVAMAHKRYCDNVKRQRHDIVSRVIELFDAQPEYKCPHCQRKFAQRTSLVRHQKHRCPVKKVDFIPRSSPYIKDALKQARDEYNEPILNEKSLSSDQEVGYIRQTGFPHSNRRMRYIVGPTEFLQITGTTKWFKNNIEKKVSYAMDQHSANIPYFVLPVVDVRNCEKQPVFDIEVVENHSFLANGLCVHNCQQRQRRFAAASSRDPEIPGFDSCCISPGTEFMVGLSKFITRFIKLKKKQSNLQIVYSSHAEPQEGEGKLLQIVRNENNGESYYIYSADADLVMLCLAAMKPSLYVAREVDGIKTCDLYVINIDKFRQSLVDVYGWNGCDPNNLGLDFVLMFFMVGNDFVPNIKTLSISENSIERILDVYKSQTNLGHLVQYSKGEEITINVLALRNLLTQLGAQEEDMINSKLNSKKCYFEDALMDKNKVETCEGSRINFEKYRKDYYNKVFGKVATKGDVRRICKDFLQGMYWIINYYTNGCQDWHWCYKHHYSPFLRDLGDNVNDFKPLEKNEPIPQHLQLMCILPPSSFNLLPEPLNQAHKDPEISDYYPDKVDIDVSGKRYEYEGVVLVPFCDMEKVKAVYERQKK